MRRWLLLGVLVFLGVCTGCVTLTESREEVRRTYSQVLDTDLRQMSADWNYINLADRQYRLTRWYTR